MVSYRKQPPPPPPPWTDTIPTKSTDTSYAVFLMEFNGKTIQSQNWNNAQLTTYASSGLRSTAIDSILNNVRSDFSPYRVIVTTDSNLYNVASKRMRQIITPTSAWYPGPTGVSYTGSIFWNDNTPDFVFSDRLNYNPRGISDISSHEFGHTIGLNHQSVYDANCVLTVTYNTGDGINAPLMGNSLNAVNRGKWWTGKTSLNCNNVQNDTLVLAAKLLHK